MAALGIAASLAGLAWTLGRIFRPWMREAAREAADGVRAEVKALGDKLAANDFPHVEARIDRVEARIGERLDRIETRRREDAAAMEARIVAALSERSQPPAKQPDADPEKTPSVGFDDLYGADEESPLEGEK
ncbi:MAG: hypothetical protein OXI12_09180 [Gammaproteobacteria bacterium]|nr:hypothetical protein [Gammaproteobacteria bacterium]